MNHWEIMGSIVATPDLRYTPKGLAIANVSVAGTMDDRAWYQRFTVFGAMGEIIANLAPGNVLYASGRVRSRTYDDATGKRKSTVDVTANMVRTLGTSFDTTHDKRGQPVLVGGTNRALVAGNITRDAEVRAAGTASVANATVAINERTGDREDTTFLRMTAWNDAPSFAMLQSLTKGAGVVAVGSIATESWEKDGARQYQTILRCAWLHPVVKDATVAPASSPASSTLASDDAVWEGLPF